MKMKLVGMTAAREGKSKKGNDYIMSDLHLMGISSRVEGACVKVACIDLMKIVNAPPLVIGNIYSVECEGNWVEEIELLVEAPKPEPEAAPPSSEKK